MRPAGNREHSFENSFEGHLPLPLGAASDCLDPGMSHPLAIEDVERGSAERSTQETHRGEIDDRDVKNISHPRP